MSKPPLFFVAVIALIAVLATQRYFKQRQQEAENDRAPMRSLQVTVSDKRSFPVAKTRAPQRERWSTSRCITRWCSALTRVVKTLRCG